MNLLHPRTVVATPSPDTLWWTVRCPGCSTDTRWEARMYAGVRQAVPVGSCACASEVTR